MSSMANDRLRERLEDEVCRDCVIEPVCSDNCYYCEAFNRLLKLYEAYEALRRLLGE